MLLTGEEDTADIERLLTTSTDLELLKSLLVRLSKKNKVTRQYVQQKLTKHATDRIIPGMDVITSCVIEISLFSSRLEQGILGIKGTS